MMIKKLDYSMWKKYLRTEITDEFTVGFQCDCCGKIFRCNKILSSFELPLQFPILEYSTPSNYNSEHYKLNFCSFECLNTLLKEVPFSFNIFAPTYFTSMNRRDEWFYKYWEIIEI